MEGLEERVTAVEQRCKSNGHRIDKVEDVLKLGDTVKVKYMGLDKKGRMDFSMKDVHED